MDGQTDRQTGGQTQLFKHMRGRILKMLKKDKNIGETERWTDKQTDKQTDRQTDTTMYRVAPQLKRMENFSMPNES